MFEPFDKIHRGAPKVVHRKYLLGDIACMRVHAYVAQTAEWSKALYLLPRETTVLLLGRKKAYAWTTLGAPCCM